MKLRYLALVAVVVLGACSTVPGAKEDRSLVELIDLVNDGPVERVVAQSHVPLFFDGELLVRRADIEMLWSGLREQGLVINPRGFAVEPARRSDYVRVADTFDIETFFSPEGPFPDNATWIRAGSDFGEVQILVGDDLDGLPLIYGIARVES
jgi:hypothetical protein